MENYNDMRLSCSSCYLEASGNYCLDYYSYRGCNPLIENGIIRFPEKGAEDMINELTNYPKWKFDDQMDGLYNGVKVIPSGSGAPIVAQAKNTAITENYQYDTEMVI